jgi:DNA repair protein RecO (recombination protein O)
MRVTLNPGFVLHRREYRDSSLILELLTRDHGRVAVVARGARRPKARLNGLLQLFTPLLVSWAGRGDLGTLTGAEPNGASTLRGRTLISGFYLNELLMKLLTRHDPHPGLFDAYDRVLRELSACAVSTSETDLPEQRALRLFEKTLLAEIGYGLVLDRDIATGAPISEDAQYDYHPERGPVRVENGALEVRDPGGPSRASPSPHSGVRLHGRSLVSLAAGELHDPESLRESKRLMRVVIGVCLDHRPLFSRALARSVVTEPGQAS